MIRVRLHLDALLCRAVPSLARYTIDAQLVSGAVYPMTSVALRSARNTAVLCLMFRAEAEALLEPGNAPTYRPRRL